MKTIMLLLGFCVLVAAPLSAQPLSWAELIRKPEHWPKETVAKKNFDFQGGKSVKAGQKLTVLELNASEVVLSTADGRLTFSAKPAETDALAVANAAYAKLTPKQRELTYAEILKRPELWPWSVKLNESFDVGRKRLNAGDTVYIMKTRGNAFMVTPSTFDLNFDVKPQDTDIMAYARKYVDAPAEAPGRLADELNSRLVNAATGVAQPIAAEKTPRYYVIYHGARWCPYTQAFTPKLLSLYQQQHAKHPDFEVIYVPAEKSQGELQQYAKELNFPWPAVDFRQKQKLAVLAGVVGRNSLPEIWVLDRHGNVVVDNSKVDRETALKQFAALLEKPDQS